MKSITEVAREFELKTHQLHEFEKRELLGSVFKDQKNNKRFYDEEQIEKIKIIVSEIKKQRRNGSKRTDYEIIKEKIFETFGGEIIEKEKNTVEFSVENLMQMISMQQKVILEMQNEIKMMNENKQNENLKIESADYSIDLCEIKELLAKSEIREENLLKKIEELEKKVEKKSLWKFWK